MGSKVKVIVAGWRPTPVKTISYSAQTCMSSVRRAIQQQGGNSTYFSSPSLKNIFALLSFVAWMFACAKLNMCRVSKKKKKNPFTYFQIEILLYNKYCYYLLLQPSPFLTQEVVQFLNCWCACICHLASAADPECTIKFSHTTPLLCILHWLPIAAWIRFNSLVLA